MNLKYKLKHLAAALIIGCGLSSGPAAQSQTNGPQRIISMAPSITEILFDLGAGDRVVGVTRFCKYPPQAQEKTDIGGFLDPNYEAIISVKPDLVIVLPEHLKAKEYLKQLNIPFIEVDHTRVEKVLSSIELLGKTLHLDSEAARIKAEIDESITRIKNKTAGLKTPRVLICLGRSRGRETFKETFVPGKGTIYDDILKLAGGSNLMGDSKIPYPVISAEGIIRLNPDVIIDLAPELADHERDDKAWLDLTQVTAVQKKRIYIFTEDFLTIPSIRLLRFIGHLAKTLHPDIQWERP